MWPVIFYKMLNIFHEIILEVKYFMFYIIQKLDSVIFHILPPFSLVP